MRIGASVLAALSGVSVWVSLGTQAITNDPNLTRIAALPPTWLALTLRSGAGFRPFAVDRASDDVRHLAVWVEIR